MRALPLIIGCVLILAGCATVPEQPPLSVDELTEQESRFAEALAHYAQGLLFEEELGRNAPQALAEFLAALECDPAAQHLYAKAALTALQQRDVQKAIAILEQGCAASPDSFEARSELAFTYQVTGDIDKAIENYRAAITLAPAQPFLYISLARLYFYQAKDDLATRTLEDSITVTPSPEQAVAFCYRQARAFLEAGEVERSVACLEVVARHASSQRAEIYRLIAELNLRLKREQPAIEAYRNAILQNADSIDTYIQLAMLQLREDAAAALETLDVASQKDPDNPGVLFARAYAHSVNGAYDEAVPRFARLEEMAAQNTNTTLTATYYFQYGAVCERLKRYDKATELLEQCLSLEPENAEALNYLAYMWADLGTHLDKAFEYVSQALRLVPGNGAYLDTLAWVYYRTARYEEALKLLVMADRTIPNDATVNDHIGDTLKALGRDADAVTYWTESYLLDNTNPAVIDKLEQHNVDLKQLQREFKRRAKNPPRPAPVEE